jgi:hypothetical protein
VPKKLRKVTWENSRFSALTSQTWRFDSIDTRDGLSVIGTFKRFFVSICSAFFLRQQNWEVLEVRKFQFGCVSMIFVITSHDDNRNICLDASKWLQTFRQQL